MALICSSVILAIVACLLQCSARADIFLPPGYGHPDARQTSSNYMPVANQQQYSGYSPTQYQPAQYPAMPVTSNQYQSRSSLESEFERYETLNKLIQQQLNGIFQNDPNQMSSMNPTLGAPAPATFSQVWTPSTLNTIHANFPGGMIYSVTPQGLKPVNNPQFGIYNGLIAGTPQQQGYYQDSQSNTGRTQWTRSIQSDGTDTGNASSPLPEVQELDAVAAHPAITETTATDIPQLGSLNESEDKQIECRAIGQADDAIVGSPLQPSYSVDRVNDQHHPSPTMNFNADPSINPSTSFGSSVSRIYEQIKPDFSNMEIHKGNPSVLGAVKADTSSGKSGEWRVSDGNANLAQQHAKSQSHPSYSQPAPSSGNWFTNTYRKYYDQARAALQQGYPFHQGHSGHQGNMNPSNQVHPSQVNSYGGHGSYNQGAYNRASTNAASSSPLPGLPNDPNSAFRTAMDYVQKGWNYQPSDLARFGNQWAQNGIAAGSQNPYIQGNGRSSSHPASSSPLSGVVNGPNSAFKTAMDYVQKGFNFQPSEWARFGNQWAKNGIAAGFQNPSFQGSSPNAALNSQSPAIPHDTNGAFKTAMDFVQNGLKYEPSDWARYGNQWAKSGISAGL